MNGMCNSLLPLVSDEFSVFGSLPGPTAGFLGGAELLWRLPVSLPPSRPPQPGSPPPATGQGTDAQPQASAVKRGPGTAVSTVKEKRQRTTQGKPEPEPLPAAALEDSSLLWNRLVAMATFAQQDIANLVDGHGVDTDEARKALVTMLTQYIGDSKSTPLPSSGRAAVPKVFQSGDTAKHGRVKNPTLSTTEVKWFYWVKGNRTGQKWFGEEPAGYKAATSAAPAVPAAPPSTVPDSGVGSPRSPQQTCIVAHPDGSPSLLNATIRLLDSPTSGAFTGTVSTGNLLYKRQQRGDKSEVEDLHGNVGWIRDKYLKEYDGTKTPVNYG